jgi:multiple sugar transport system substrate-binding protein
MKGVRARALAAVASFAFALALTLVAAGCGGGGKGGAKTVVVFWQFFPTEQVQPVLDEFERLHPDVDVQMEQLTWQSGLEKITAAVAAGTVPDLCELGSTWFPRFAAQGALADWSDSAGPLESDYLLFDLARSGGKTYGLPWLVGSRALFWNKELFARAGIDTTREPETWPELLEAVRRVNGLGGGIAGYGANAGERYVLFKKFMPYAWSNDGALLTDDGSRSAFDSPQNVEALDFYLTLAKQGRVDRQDQLDEAFIAGKLGAQISGAWLLKKIPAQAPALRYGVSLVPMPAADRGRHASFAGGEILVSFNASKQKAAAWQLARFLASKEQAMKVALANHSVQPAARSAVDDPAYVERPGERKLLEQLASAVPTPNHPDWLDMEQAIEEEVEQALYGKKSAAAAVHAASLRIDQVIAKSAQAASSANSAASPGAH